MLDAVAVARRAPTTCDCGAPIPWGSHFCANCGRPVGAEPVVACEGCGHPLPADAELLRQLRPTRRARRRRARRRGGAAGARTHHDETIVHAAAKRSSDPWER